MSATWHSHGNERAWRALRVPVLKRDGYRCRMGDPDHPIGKTQERHPKCTGGTTHDARGYPLLQVHHTLGREVTGDGDMRYLVTACRTCNVATGDPTRHDPAPRPMTEW